MKGLRLLKKWYPQNDSIISICNSKKQVKDWFKNQSANELINELLGLGKISQIDNVYDKKFNDPKQILKIGIDHCFSILFKNNLGKVNPFWTFSNQAFWAFFFWNC